MHDIHIVNRINDYYAEKLNENDQENDHNENKEKTVTDRQLNDKSVNNYDNEYQHQARNKVVSNNTSLINSKIRSSSQIDKQQEVSKGNFKTNVNRNNKNESMKKAGLYVTNKTLKTNKTEILNDNQLEPSLSQKLQVVSPYINAEEQQQVNLNSNNNNNQLEGNLSKMIKDNPFFKLAKEKNTDSNWEEITFRILLTENEYKLLVLEKANKIKLK